MTAVTLAGLVCGCALLASRRDESGLGGTPVAVKRVILTATVAVTALAFIGLVSNCALSASAEAATRDDWPKAESEARKATRWAPWSAAGWLQLGEVQLQQGKLAEARSSFRKAIAKDPNDWLLWLNLALAGEADERREPASVALQLNPLSPQIESLRPALGLPERSGG